MRQEKKNTSTFMENTVFNKRINMLELNGLLLSGWLLQKTVPNYILLKDNNKILWLWLCLSGPVFWVIKLSKPCQQTQLRASRRAAELHMRHVHDQGPRLSLARHAPRAKSSAFLLTSSPARPQALQEAANSGLEAMCLRFPRRSRDDKLRPENATESFSFLQRLHL